MTRSLFFFHNPKAAGTAVGRVLSAMYPADSRCPLIENTEREHVAHGGSYIGYRGFRYYGGHYGRDVFAQVEDGHVAVTCFRDPAERLLSLYTYFRGHVTVPDDPSEADNLYPVAFAQAQDFASFVATEDPRIELHTRNHHARQLTGSGWAADEAVDMDRAFQFVERMPWFYVCAHPTLSQAWGGHVFGAGFGAIARENATRATDAAAASCAIDGATRRTIARKNTHDTALHRHAVRRLLS